MGIEFWKLFDILVHHTYHAPFPFVYWAQPGPAQTPLQVLQTGGSSPKDQVDDDNIVKVVIVNRFLTSEVIESSIACPTWFQMNVVQQGLPYLYGF